MVVLKKKKKTCAGHSLYLQGGYLDLNMACQDMDLKKTLMQCDRKRDNLGDYNSLKMAHMATGIVESRQGSQVPWFFFSIVSAMVLLCLDVQKQNIPPPIPQPQNRNCQRLVAAKITVQTNNFKFEKCAYYNNNNNNLYIYI